MQKRVSGFTLQIYEAGGETQGQGSWTPIGTRDKQAGVDLTAQQDSSCSSPIFHSGKEKKKRKEKQINLTLLACLVKPSHRLRFNIVKLFLLYPLLFFFSHSIFFCFFFSPVELVVIKWQWIPMWQTGAVRWRMKQSYFLIKTLMDSTQWGWLLGLLMRGRYDHPISSCERNSSRSGAVIVSAPLSHRTFISRKTLWTQINAAKLQDWVWSAQLWYQKKKKKQLEMRCNLGCPFLHPFPFFLLFPQSPLVVAEQTDLLPRGQAQWPHWPGTPN